MPLIDADVLTLAIEGDCEAFRTLFNRYMPRLGRVLWRILKDRDDVPDVLQETFLRAWRRLPEFRGESEFETWIMRIAINCAADRRRDNERHEHLRLDVEEIESPDPYGDRLVQGSEIRHRMGKAVMVMTEAERVASSLRFVEGMPFAAISGTLGISKDAARQAVERAVRKIRAALKEVR